MAEIIRFPRPPRWPGLYFRFWSESLERLAGYLENLRTMETDMSDVKFEYPADAPLMITTRTFDAPRVLVWKCFSEPRHIARWWGPASISPVARVDKFEFRAGGKWRIVTERPDGTQTIVFHGTYKEIVAPERIVNTFAVEGMVAENDLLTETHSFEDRGEKTFYRAVSVLDSIETRDGIVAGGMERGAREALDQLDALLAELLEVPE